MKSSILVYLLVVLIIVVGAIGVVYYFNNNSVGTSQESESTGQLGEPNSMQDELQYEEESIDEDLE